MSIFTQAIYWGTKKEEMASWINGMARETPQYDDDIGQLAYVAFLGQWDIGWNQALWGHNSAHWG
jgi:hypothetical protein